MPKQDVTPTRRIKDCKIHPTATICDFVNLYECRIGPKAFIGPFVEIQKGAEIGAESRISSHSFVCEGVSIGRQCFIAHGVMFINDRFDSPPGRRYILRRTRIGNRVRIGSNATLLPVRIGTGATIGAGAVVIKDVPAGEVWAGNPAHPLKHVARRRPWER